jgi:hypothetical protein
MCRNHCHHIIDFHHTRITVFQPTMREIRAVPSAFANSGNSHQAWFEDMLDMNWKKAKKTTGKLVADRIGVQQWADDFFDAILQANANAHWIGRDLVSGTKTKFGKQDILKARGIADVDAEYLQGFIDDIESGRYTDDEGNLIESQILNRQKLYMGKVRGIAGQASVDNLELTTKIYWTLGGNEVHCVDCPVLANISPFFKDDLFTTPGACDTPCLGNCKCHLRIEMGDTMIETIKPVTLLN